jgi:hypothetical protein
MELRDFIRKPVMLKAEIIAGDNIYNGIIKNLAESGAFLEAVPAQNVTDFIPCKKHGLQFKLPSEDIFILDCEVIWLYTKKITSSGLKQNNIGTIIIAPQLKYKKFIKSLS